MKKLITLFIVFLIINFGGLAIGNWLMDTGPQTDWYINLNQAPWTPAGWVFGFAWTTIMICFSIYLTVLFNTIKVSLFIVVLGIEFVLNVSWNYVFFNQHLVNLGLVIITLLTIVIFYYFFQFQFEKMKKYRLLLLPYIIWLCIATSLNLYICLYN
ncbi:TspO/MBR family protein [Ichthyenterobacterium sp. W332]|uniref:TspO/MBR family protein n=1 Tax=Microcosmobacter mediterraneus TaxID=3075607 RepID=A0ABU2YIU7_9FLAO|nr:TspO/MBR family protein [Ichthyenterobacterium sp. W332]MDT0557594.1 TspO/MBR family protein [Ichthyenterobacterium sp. W332]